MLIRCSSLDTGFGKAEAPHGRAALPIGFPWFFFLVFFFCYSTRPSRLPNHRGGRKLKTKRSGRSVRLPSLKLGMESEGGHPKKNGGQVYDNGFLISSSFWTTVPLPDFMAIQMPRLVLREFVCLFACLLVLISRCCFLLPRGCIMYVQRILVTIPPHIISVESVIPLKSGTSRNACPKDYRTCVCVCVSQMLAHLGRLTHTHSNSNNTHTYLKSHTHV